MVMTKHLESKQDQIFQVVGKTGASDLFVFGLKSDLKLNQDQIEETLSKLQIRIYPLWESIKDLDPNLGS